MTSTITPFVPGTRNVFMSPRFSHLSVDVSRESGNAYLYDGCAIVDTRTDVADMSIKDAQDWCMEYERSLWGAAHEEALAEDAERAGFFEVPEATPTRVFTPVTAEERAQDVRDLINDRDHYLSEAKWHQQASESYWSRGMVNLAETYADKARTMRAMADECTADIAKLRGF